MPHSFLKTSVLVAALALCTYGTHAAAQTGGAPAPSANAQAVNTNMVAAHYGHLVHASYTDTLNAAKALQTAVQAFTAKPHASSTARRRPSASTAAPLTTTTARKAASTPGPWTNRLWTA
jgi:putative iron-regulated protein